MASSTGRQVNLDTDDYMTHVRLQGTDCVTNPPAPTSPVLVMHMPFNDVESITLSLYVKI